MQVFLESPSCRGRFTEQLAPVCSRTVYSARVMSQLQIIEMSDTTSPASGGKKIILVCEKVCKEDIKVRLSDGAGWEDWAQFEVHKQCAIVLRSPQYSRPDITQAVRVSLQLVRPSDGATSQEESFFYLPPLPQSHHPDTLPSYAGVDLLGASDELQLNIPVIPVSPRPPQVEANFDIPVMISSCRDHTNPALTDANQISLDDILDNSDDNLLNLSDIMKDLGLKTTMAGVKRSSKDAENDSASLTYLTKMGDQNHIANHSEFLFNCDQINDL